ncbi:MAG: tetratricopeptide (TPR) repeat protein [Candidatus Omnitrophota bacterium]|jgi:tetratricopeptide (TPR) repeat protein
MVILGLGGWLALVTWSVADPDDTLYVEGLAVDGLGLHKVQVLELFSSVERSPGALPEFSLAKPLFTGDHGPAPEQVRFFREFSQAMLSTKMNSQDWFMAMEIIENRLAYKPGDLESLKSAAGLASVMKDYRKAETYFSEYLKQRPKDLLMQAGLAHLLLHMGQHTNAEQVCADILAVNPTSVEARFSMLCTYLARDLEPKAMLVDEAYWLFRLLPEKRMIAGWLAGDREELLRLMNADGFQRLAAYTLGPGTHENVTLIFDALNKAELAYRSRQWGEALVYYDLAKDYGVRSVFLYEDIARCYLEMGEVQKALDVMKTLVLTAPDVPQIWSNVGYILMQSSLYVEATKAYRQALKLDASNPNLLFGLAAAYAGVGQLDQAWPLLERLAKTHPEQMSKWLEGDKPYLQAIQQDRRFPLLF